MLGKILCWMGLHRWSASLEDYIEEFGSIPMDGGVAKNSKCERCGELYDK